MNCASIVLMIIGAEATVSAPAQYGTLESMLAHFQDSSQPITIEDSVRGIHFGYTFTGATRRDVLQALAADPRLVIVELPDGKGRQILENPAFAREAREKRGRLLGLLKRSFSDIYKRAWEQLEKYCRDRPAPIDFTELSISVASEGDPAQTLLREFASANTRSFGQIGVPNLVTGLLSPDGAASSRVDKLSNITSFVAPTVRNGNATVPYSLQRPDEGILLFLLGPPDENPEAKRARLDSILQRLDCRWDPATLNASYNLMVDSTWSDFEGNPYPGKYKVAAVSGVLAPKGLPGIHIPIQDVLGADAAETARSRMDLTQRLLSDDRAFAKPLGEKVAQLTRFTDVVLRYANAQGVSMVVPISSFFDVKAKAQATLTFSEYWKLALESPDYWRDTSRNAALRLGARPESVESTYGYPHTWGMEQVGGVYFLTDSSAYLEPLSHSQLLDPGLANKRLSGENVALNDLIKVVANKQTLSLKHGRSFSNEVLSWCDPVTFHPVARMLVKAPSVLDAVCSEGAVNIRIGFGELPEDAKRALADGLRTIADYHVEGAEYIGSADVTWAHVTFLKDKDMVLEVRRATVGAQTRFRFLRDGEPMWVSNVSS